MLFDTGSELGAPFFFWEEIEETGTGQTKKRGKKRKNRKSCFLRIAKRKYIYIRGSINRLYFSDIFHTFFCSVAECPNDIKKHIVFLG